MRRHWLLRFLLLLSLTLSPLIVYLPTSGDWLLGPGAIAYADDDDDDGYAFEQTLAAPDGGDWVVGEILAINLKHAQLKLARRLGFPIIKSARLRQLGLTTARLRVPGSMSAREALVLLRRELPGEQFLLNHIYRLSADPCRGERCVAHDLIQWPRPDARICDLPVRIGMLDTAVNRRVAGLGLLDFRSTRFPNNKSASDSAHGTAVAALLGGRPSQGIPGLLPNSTLYAADIFYTTDSEQTLTTADLMVRGLDWLLAKDLDAINISVAGPDNELLKLAIEQAMQRGIPIIAAAGNEGPRAKPAYPAAYQGVIAVTAVDARLRLYRQASRGKYVTIAAPGVSIWTPSNEGGEYRNGTSFAAPFVTAVAAAIGHGRNLSITELREQLAARTRDLGAPGRDPLYGWGLIKAQGACNKAEN